MVLSKKYGGNKMRRKIIQIDKDKCNGCALCVSACHEGAIQMINGKAELVSDLYCDGLGDCLPACPTDAIKIIERTAEAYNQEAVDQRLIEIGRIENKTTSHKESLRSEPCSCEVSMKKDEALISAGCPGSKVMEIQLESNKKRDLKTVEESLDVHAKLTTWPIQLKLLNVDAEYLKNADILIAADCTAFAYGNFHKDFIEGRVCLIGCPKLDDNQFYAKKLTEIFSKNNIKSITVVRMEVPCCSGIVQAVKSAMLNSETIVPYNVVTIGLNGIILK